MTRLVCAMAIGAALALAGCGERLVERPINRPPAAVVELATGPIRCPADTVVHSDQAAESGAGSVPADFEARTVLLCQVDLTRGQLRGGFERLPTQQWRAPLTPELRAALDLPDRELRPTVACASGEGGITAVYLVDARRRAIRVLLPTDDPCSRIRVEVTALLPSPETPADDTFTATRPR